MLATKIEQKKNEEGFTLIELLVVVIIIGILAAIAIPVFLNQRESAWRSAGESDARNAAIAIETYYTVAKAYPAGPETWDTTTTTLTADGSDVATITVSDDVSLAYTYDSTEGSFEIVATHAQIDSGDTTVATYNSGTGGLS